MQWRRGKRDDTGSQVPGLGGGVDDGATAGGHRRRDDAVPDAGAAIYWAGITWIRTLAWAVASIGLVLILVQLL
jgi:hypothetical protein